AQEPVLAMAGIRPTVASGRDYGFGRDAISARRPDGTDSRESNAEETLTRSGSQRQSPDEAAAQIGSVRLHARPGLEIKRGLQHVGLIRQALDWQLNLTWQKWRNRREQWRRQVRVGRGHSRR